MQCFFPAALLACEGVRRERGKGQDAGTERGQVGQAGKGETYIKYSISQITDRSCDKVYKSQKQKEQIEVQKLISRRDVRSQKCP